MNTRWMRRPMKGVVLVVLCVLVTWPVRSADASDSDDEEVDTSTSFVQQYSSQWCWAATVEMVTGTGQCDVVSVRVAGQGSTVCCNAAAAMSPLCNQGSGGPTVLTNALTFWGAKFAYSASALTGKQLRKALRAGGPVIAASLPHAVVISGFTRDSGQTTYHVLDPLQGEMDETYSQLLNHGGYPWQMSWRIDP